MRNTDCNICQTQNIPINETIKIDLKVYCTPCFDKQFTDESQLRGRLVEKERDPTVCFNCDKDFDEIELKKLSVYPVCPACEITIKNKTFPVWVKCFLAGLAAIVIISFIWNWKYYSAYNNFKNSNQYFEKGDFARSAATMEAASIAVPEVEDLKILAAYSRGVDLLTKDSSEKALKELNICKGALPESYGVNGLILKGRIGASFDSKDYEGFLATTKENLALDSNNATSMTSVASAYACIYADKGTSEAKENAVAYLNKAKAVDDTTTDLIAYYNMVEYRIDSRKIIRIEAFKKLFPNGWTKIN